MRLLFLIPLSLGMIFSYIFRDTDEDIAYLTNIIILVNFAVSLIIAPWQVQLIILVILLITVRRFLLKNQQEITQEGNVKTEVIGEELSQNNQDKNTIKYRGVSYEIHSTEANITEGEIVGKYRGKELHSHKIPDNLVVKNDHNPKYHLKYRGVSMDDDDKSKDNKS